MATVTGVVVDAGHGGDDPGAVSGNLKEKDLTLQAAQYLYQRLRDLGIPATIIRDSDETISPEERVRRVLAAYGNDPNVIVISNHINAGGGEGAEVIYALRNSNALAQSVLENIGLEGQEMRKYYQRRLPENPMRDYYFIHRDTGSTQPLLVEYGFIDNDVDVQRLENNLLNYVEGVVRAIAQYGGFTYRPPAGSGSEYYTVQRNDSLWAIAQRFGVTVQQLRDVNNLTSDSLQIGQILKIPGAGDSNVPPSNDNNNSGTNTVKYTVKRNDSLWAIAQQYGISVQDIINANGLSSTELQIGQVLTIPVSGGSSETPPSSGDNSSTNYYTVKRNDSLWSIARDNGTTVDAIINANNLTSTELQIGQRLIIPSSSTDNDNTSNTSTYRVASGDSLYSIAKKFNTSVNELTRLNNLNSTLLQIGQILIVPSNTSSGGKTYVVTLDDSLWSIARDNGTTVQAIKNLNNLTSDVLDVGQVLQLP